MVPTEEGIYDMGFAKGSLILALGGLALAGCAPNYGPGSHQAWSQCSSQAIYSYNESYGVGAVVLGPIYEAATSNASQDADACMRARGYRPVSG